MRLSFWFDIIISNLAEILKRLFFVQHAWDLRVANCMISVLWWNSSWACYYTYDWRLALLSPNIYLFIYLFILENCWGSAFSNLILHNFNSWGIRYAKFTSCVVCICNSNLGIWVFNSQTSFDKNTNNFFLFFNLAKPFANYFVCFFCVAYRMRVAMWLMD
jgi:hypothetical protein